MRRTSSPPDGQELAEGSQDTAADLAWLRAFTHAATEVSLDEPPSELRGALRASFRDHFNHQTEPTGVAAGLIDRFIAALNFDSGLQHGLAGARAGVPSATRQLVYSTDALDVSLSIQGEANGLRIDGQILPVVDLSLDGFQAQLHKDNETVIQAQVDEFGHFAFSSITPDTYQLTFGTALLTVVLEVVDFRV